MPDLDLMPLRSLLTELAPQGRAGLLPALHAAQDIYGYLPEPVAAEVAHGLGIPLADVYGVIDFYALFYREPVGQTVVRICADPICALRGADAALDAARRQAQCDLGGVSPDGQFTVERSPCLGMCNVGVAAHVSQRDPATGATRHATFAHVTPDTLDSVFALQGQPADDYVGGDLCIVSVLCGKGRAASLIEYEAAGGMQALKRALRQGLAPEALIAEIEASGLFGRGGAAFPTHLKWEGARRAPGGPKYLVVNADESEPGTFKDRVLMEGDPCRILEGAILAAYAIGARRATFYIRGEYPLALARVRHALAELQAAGYLGQNILGSGYGLEIEVRSGAGAYICGEETALFESIEGKQGFPRVKPPFPITHGLFGRPTVVQNVETLAKIPYILTHGPAAFHRFGTPRSTGPKLFCVSGDVVRPGLYEAPFGVTLRHMIDDLAGGVTGAGLQAVLIGGAAGAFATEAQLDTPLTFEDLAAARLPLGSAAIMVFNQSRDLRDTLRRLGRFFAHESCGKCYPCQLGTRRQFEILDRLARGQPLAGDRARLEDVGWTMTDASLCGLGQTAASATLSALRLWPHLVDDGRRTTDDSQ